MTENSTYNTQGMKKVPHCGLLVRKQTRGTSAPFYTAFGIEMGKNVPMPMDENTIFSVYSFDATKKLSATESIVDHTNIGFFSESEMIDSLSNLFGMRITKPNELEMEAQA